MVHERLNPNLRDVAFTTETPFTAGAEEVDQEALSENLESMFEAGARRFIPCGTTGEYYALTQTERVEIIRTHVETVGERATVIGGLAGSSKTALSLIDAYEEVGVDGVMVMDPDHTHAHEHGLVSYYERLADVANVGIVIYKRSHDISKRVLVEVTEHENVVGVKNAVNDINGFASTVNDGSDDCGG